MPAWEQVEKVIRKEGRLFIKVPSGSVPPQELDVNNPAAAFAEVLSALNSRYTEAKHNFDRAEGQAIPALQCGARGQVILLLAQPLIKAERREVENNFGTK